MKKQAICLATCTLLVSGFITDVMTAQPEKDKAALPAVTDAPRKFVAYYFHGDFRCDNCRKIEQYSREAIEKYFSDQLKSGDLEFKVVNTDRAENQHFTLNALFNYCVNVFNNANLRKLTSIEVHGIVCKIAQVVVVGGVRRSALISLSNLSDDRMRHAKSGSWWENSPE